MQKPAFGMAARLCLGAALIALVSTDGLPVSLALVDRAIAQAPGGDEKAAFAAAKELGTVEAWDAFLSNYPKGFYADLARAYVKKLAEQPAAGALSFATAAPTTSSSETKPPVNTTGLSCKELKARCSKTDTDYDCGRYLGSCTGHGDN